LKHQQEIRRFFHLKPFLAIKMINYASDFQFPENYIRNSRQEFSQWIFIKFFPKTITKLVKILQEALTGFLGCKPKIFRGPDFKLIFYFETLRKISTEKPHQGINFAFSIHFINQELLARFTVADETIALVFTVFFSAIAQKVFSAKTIDMILMNFLCFF